MWFFRRSRLIRRTYDEDKIDLQFDRLPPSLQLKLMKGSKNKSKDDNEEAFNLSFYFLAKQKITLKITFPATVYSGFLLVQNGYVCRSFCTHFQHFSIFCVKFFSLNFCFEFFGQTFSFIFRLTIALPNWSKSIDWLFSPQLSPPLNWNWADGQL